jgi:hypothetical protein
MIGASKPWSLNAAGSRGAAEAFHLLGGHALPLCGDLARAALLAWHRPKPMPASHLTDRLLPVL